MCAILGCAAQICLLAAVLCGSPATVCPYPMSTAGICHTGLLTACEQDQDGTGLVLLLYNIYHGCVYSEKLLMVDRGTVRNM